MSRRKFLKTLGAGALTYLAGNALVAGVRSLMQPTFAQGNKLAMPAVYIPHGGGPCFFMDANTRQVWQSMGDWLTKLAATLPQKPSSILVVSAHWEEPEVTVNTASKPDLLYDYYGFPAETYQIKYGVPGSPALAGRVAALLKASGVNCLTDNERGLDHGVFVPLKLIYPDADIPLVQLSLKQGLDPAAHIAIGKALAPLREEGVLIIGSGMSYHNLSRFGGESAGKDAAAFDQWLGEVVCHEDVGLRDKRLSNWATAPKARVAHPREEHLLPLMVVAGAAGADVGKRIYNDKTRGIPISGFSFG